MYSLTMNHLFIFFETPENRVQTSENDVCVYGTCVYGTRVYGTRIE